MLRKLLKYLLVASAPLLAGCSDDFGGEPGAGGGMLSISLMSHNSTRASDTDDSKYNEDKIENVVLAFYPNGYGEDTEALAVYKPGEFTLTGTNAATTVEMKLTPDRIRTLFADTHGVSCKFFAIANLSDDEIASIAGNPTISELRSLPISSQFATKKTQDSFVMSGVGSVVYTKNSERDKSASGSGTLARTASKISLSISIDESVTDDDGNTWTPLTTGENIRVLLNEGVSSSTLTSDGDQDGNTYFSTKLSQGSLVRYMSGTGIGDYPYVIDVPMYSYPNKWDNSSLEEQHRTSITLVMTWRRGTGGTYRTFYYQVPVTPGESLVSNHSYQVNLHVGMLGSLTPDTAVEVTGVSYQVVKWGSASVDVNLSDTRYLIVNPSSFEINNEASFRIPFYSSHDVEISDISLTLNRFNFYSDVKAEPVTLTLGKAVIDNSNDKAAADDQFCTYSIEYEEATKQYYIVINHPLKVWEPYNSSGNEIKLTGYAEGTNAATVANTISYMSPTSDNSFSKYTINLKLQHKDNSNFVETVEIDQYPGMYVTPIANPGGSYNSRFIHNVGGGLTQGSTSSLNSPATLAYYYGVIDYGYAYVNPTTIDVTINRVRSTYIVNDERLGGLRIPYKTSGSEYILSSRNANMYVITVTQLDAGSDYIIGDPRATFIDNNLSGTTVSARPSVAGDWCWPADALYGNTSRKLTYYYPTMEGNTTQKMIAPKFRIASQYGNLGSVQGYTTAADGTYVPYNTTHVTVENARRRLATYQEQNCPAGRWRLPTKAELEFIVALQQKGYIPNLFSTSSSGYVTAQGAYKINDDGSLSEVTDVSTHYVRGVYDEWYWEQRKDYVLKPTEDGVYNYTFGDVPR